MNGSGSKAAGSALKAWGPTGGRASPRSHAWLYLRVPICAGGWQGTWGCSLCETHFPQYTKALKAVCAPGPWVFFYFFGCSFKKISGWWTSLGSLVVKTPGFQCRGTDLILGGGTKIPHVSQDGQKVIKKIIKMVIGILRIASNWPRRREEGRGLGRVSEAQGGRRTGSTPSPE